MIVKKLLNHTERHLTDMGLDGTKELQYVHIPGLANPLDRRCGVDNIKRNAVAYRRAQALESKSIMDWISAFNKCRSHYAAAFSPGSGNKKSGGRGGRAAQGSGEDAGDVEEDLADVQAANRAAAADNAFISKIEYYLPCIMRPVITTEDLADINDDSVNYDSVQVSMYPSGCDVSHGFQEAAVTLVARPVVSEDFFMDFQRGYDVGSFPPLIRIVLLDFVIGCSDPAVAECVLSDADLVPLTTLGRQQRFYSVQSNCMDNYIRQDVYGAWKAGFQKHQVEMSKTYSRAETGNKSWQVTKLLMEKASVYAQQAIQFHCSNISDGVYRSEIVTHVFEVYQQLKGELHERLKRNVASWGRSDRPSEWNFIDSTSQMRLLFYRGLREFNQDAKMSYTNIAIVTELFTTMIQWFIHPGNATWSCWLIPLQVVPQKAQLYRAYNKDGSKAICQDKPNSTGVDEVACRSFEGMMCLCNPEVSRSDGRALDLAMCKAGRETPVARERRNKVMVCNNKVAAEPDPSLVNRMQSSTEERNLGDADLDAKIRVTPRNRTTIRDGTVFTTDTNDKGTREAQRWEPVGGYNPALHATNCQINNARNQEQWATLLVATKCMSTGRDTEKKRKRTHRGDFTVNHASGSSQGVRDSVKCKELSTLLCVLPHLTGVFVGFMNKLGFTSMEISPLTQMYMDYLYWRFDSLFSKFVGVRLGKSFQRTCQGHYGRHIADFTMARLTLESVKEPDFDKALATTMNVMGYNCLPVGAVPGWMDDSMREGIDGQLLVLHTVISPMLNVPALSLQWLCKALLPYETLSDEDRSYVDNHEDAMKLALWVKGLVDNDMFVYEQEVTITGGGQGPGGADSAIRVERGQKRVHPYISTASNATDEHSYLRTRTKNRGFAEEIAKKVVKHPDMVTYSKNTGFTCDDKVVKCMIDRTTHMTLALESAFGTYELCNPTTLFSIAQRKLGDYAVVSPISEAVQSNTNAMLDPSYAMMQTISVQDTTEVMFGVNMTLAVVMTSLLGGNNVPNSQVDERLTRSLMWLMMRDVPIQFTGQDGSRYLRKNFRGNCPNCDFNVLEGYNEPRPAYIVRPTHDHEKEFNRMTHFACTVYKSYAPEDCVHMSELTSLAKSYAARTILDISLTYATPRYMCMFDTRYPVVFTYEGMDLECTRLGRRLEDSVSISALTVETSIVALASTIWLRGDVYTLCGSNTGRHADAPRMTSGNRKHNSPYCHYIPAVVSYPSTYPTKMAQLYSIFVEVAYSMRGDSEQVRYEMMEINLEVDCFEQLKSYELVLKKAPDELGI
ncbi:hypothetical protein T484DRAFT_1859938 [Baffinella frigidus]|nr:hypothetical protein T484DRAFT_1859938 [Cryptophyta sp. CCMP2293]